jgi:hypothetical protein
MPRSRVAPRVAFWVVLATVAGARAGQAGGRSGYCGTVPGRPTDSIWAHREQESRRGGVRALAATRGAAAFPVGQVAVVLDEGDVALVKNDLDLVGIHLGFAPVAGGYTVTRGAMPLSTDPGTPLAFADDDTREMALPFAFPFYGRTFDRVFVNSDGNLTFGAGDSASTPRRVGRLVGGPPRIAPLLTDLDPSAGGVVSTLASSDRFVVTWRDVPNFESTIKNTFEVVLSADGHIDFVYGAELNGNFEEGVTGIAPGQGQGGLLAVDFRHANGETGGGALAESFRSENEIDEVAVARKYFASFPDEVDQLVVYTDRHLTASGTFAYERGVKNEIGGLGEEIYDASADYGSAGRLQSFVMMDTLSKYPDDLNQKFLNGVDSDLSVLAHETGHMWLTRALFRDGSTSSNALLGRQLAHWSFFMNSSASFLEGNEIQDQGGGRFQTTAASVRYSPLDQYLMGLRAADEVPSFFYVAGVTGVAEARDRTPEVGVAFGGTRRDVSLADVVAAIGPRSPTVGQSPKVLRQSFVFVCTSASPAEADLAKLERIRAAFPAFYAAGTEGRGQVDPRIN